MDILGNAVVVSVLVMAILCVLRLNVLLAIFIAALCAGVLSPNLLSKYQDSQRSETDSAPVTSHYTESQTTESSSIDSDTFNVTAKDFLDSLLKIVIVTGDILINGMAGNLNVALSYILLGAIATAISRTNLMPVLLHGITKNISDRRIMFVLSIACLACFSQNLIPVHIAFIPILIPPLLSLMNKLQIDRRAVACALTFGLQAPYVTFGVGFGLIFHTVIKDQMVANGMQVGLSDIASVMWIGGVAMLVGLFLAVFILYKKPRIYKDSVSKDFEKISMSWREYAVLVGVILAFVGQLITGSLPLGAFVGLLGMIILGGIKWGEIDLIMEGGLKMMAFIAFVMLVAAGYGEVLRQSGEVQNLVNTISTFTNTKFMGAILMLLVGLLITTGIGTSFGTVPIIAAIYVPLSADLGFSVEATILLIGIAGALGDAGSPASDSTLGPTSGLNADSQHDHIRDTCIPTFLVYNLSLLTFGVIGAMVL
ncbi:Na+/H+ antiporter family protein [Helicobacter sp. MIT 14-3879]|uniref:Na+/H+ antiporter family protein n=1 Tax=Helicobacter sp. MIT 14-3879 TaxID=2040649 RepID=UPI000E1F6194|nr:Na+/H+ antiporter NhaC family protein [Helicobacter sp. MIT 14-3879]RDU61732.1 sodium:proton antiporter [Helicobacter sp. MIT 14-3879]